MGSTIGTVDLLPAGSRLGVLGIVIMNNDTSVPASLEVSVKNPGQPSPATPTSFNVVSSTFTHYQDGDLVTGELHNTSAQQINGVKVTALAFDANGQIVGAAESISDSYFIPASSTAPVALMITSTGTPVQAQLYATVSSFSPPPSDKDGLQPLQLVAAGFSQDPKCSTCLTAAFIVQNLNTDQDIYAAPFMVAAYDASGALLAVITDYMAPISDVFPGDKNGMVVAGNIPNGTRIDHIHVLIGQGKHKPVSGPNPLVCDKPDFSANPYPSVSGLVLNNGTKDAVGVNVYAILYDDKGTIIGGGRSVERIPANGKVTVAIQVIFVGVPVRVELYAGLDILGR